MKKIIVICVALIISTCSINPVFAEYNPNPLGLEQEEYESLIGGSISASVTELSRLDIVRKPFERWNKEDTITRRNACEMLYITAVPGQLRYMGKYEELDGEVEMSYLEEFTDVKCGTYDHALLMCLRSEELFHGKMDSEGNKFAAFDENITYYEAFCLLSHLFTKHYRYRSMIYDVIESWDTAYPYYIFAKEIGLINNNSIASYSTLYIDEGKMNDPIPAYEFMHLLCTAIYIPHLCHDCYSGQTMHGHRYVDDFVVVKSEDEWYHDEGEIWIP